MSKSTYIRQFAEEAFAAEIKALVKDDPDPKPVNWAMSPRQVLLFLTGGKTKGGKKITPKYFGQQRLLEIAIATLLTDRALLLVGVPGTAKTWLSEHLSAAISGQSQLMVQGTSGTSEDAIRYGWNYAKLLQEGPSKEALVPSPIMRGMEEGKLVRIEELTRIPSDIQDALITILSEKSMPIPELGIAVRATPGFNLIGTANDRDKGIHDLSSALQRRFNTVRLPLPATMAEEVEIVQYRVTSLAKEQGDQRAMMGLKEMEKLITVFRELRSGQSEDGEMKLKSPSATLSTAEAISAVTNSQFLMRHFEQPIEVAMAESIASAVLRDPKSDRAIFKEYLETVIKRRKDWGTLYEACKVLADG